MPPAIDLDAYFDRVGYAGPRTPTLETLRAIHLQHAQAIPFENLNPLLKWPVRLDPQSLHQKLVVDGRGGYCFEQNLLLSHALQGVGFDVTWLAARVVWDTPENAVTPRSHMLLLINLDGTSYIADAGFGGLTLTGPLRLQPGLEQATPHEPFRLVSAGDEFLLQAQFGGSWRTLYRFGLQEQFLADYNVTNWYLSNHPESRFVTRLIAARPDADRRYALLNNELTVHCLDGRTERRVLGTVAELQETLRTVFRLKVPVTPDLDTALARICAMRHSALA
jgi:N-hydroxyarylamine O-acetyltransferase